MRRPERAVAMVTSRPLLNVFLVTAALAVVTAHTRSLSGAQTAHRRRPGRSCPRGATPRLAPVAGAAPLPASGSLAARLAGPMQASGLGANLSGTAIDAISHKTLFRRLAVRPARGARLDNHKATPLDCLTSVAVLASVGPDHRFHDQRGPQRQQGDPRRRRRPDADDSAGRPAYPRPATLTDLAKQTSSARTAAALRIGVKRVDLAHASRSAAAGTRPGRTATTTSPPGVRPRTG